MAKTKTEFQKTQERDDYVQAKEKELVDVDMQLQQLKDKANQLQGPEQENLNSKVDAVQAKRDAAKEQLDQVSEAEPANWEQMKADTDKTFDELKQSLNEAQSNQSQPAQPQTPDTPQTDTSQSSQTETGQSPTSQPQSEQTPGQQ